VPEAATRQRIGAAGRFIQEQNLRLVQQCGRHRQALLEAPRQLRAHGAQVLAELKLLGRPGDASAPAFPAQAVGAGEEFEIL
jgi:hypothetical protein